VKRGVLLAPFFLALVVIGVGISGAGSVIPEIAERFSLPYALSGRVFFFQGLGYFLALILGGILGDFVFRGTVLRLGLLLAVLGFLGIAVGSSFSWLLFAFLVMGVGVGFVDCMVNPVAQSLFPERPGEVLNFIHAFFGLGSLLAPRLYAFLHTRGYGFQSLYGLVTGLVAVTAGLFFLPFIPRNVSAPPGSAVFRAFTRKTFLLLGGTMLLYAAGVSTFNGWLVTYLKSRGLPQVVGAVYLSYFWLGLLVGRFVLASFSERAGYLTLMQTNALGGALGIALFLLSGTSSFLAPLLLFFAGFSLSTLIPLTLTYAMTTFPEVSSTASGWVLFNNGLGTFLFPWLFGFVGGRFGFAVVLAAVPCALLGVFLFQQLLVRTGRRIPEEKGAVTCADRRP